MKRAAVVGGLVTLGLGILGLGVLEMRFPEREAIAAETTTPNPDAPDVNRDVFYFSEYGFRFVMPKGFTVVPSEEQSTAPVPVQHLEIWNLGDFYNRGNQTENPPIVRIRVFENPQGLPLRDWKGELSEEGDRPISVAGQEGLAYSATGLYESDNVVFSSPDGRYVIRIRADYIGPEDDTREVFQGLLQSFVFDLVPGATGTTQIDYSHLQQHLAAQDWQRADLETRAILSRIWQRDRQGDLYYGSSGFLANLPCEDVRTIDQLWSAASQGRLGLRAQQRIWETVSAQTTDPRERVDRFGQAVGWRRDTPWGEDNPFGFVLVGSSWNLDTTMNVSEPVDGQFPWGGISASRLESLLAETATGCGSCTTDAMYLVSDRYYEYIPALFERLDTCLCNEAKTEE
ncbi:GUN4 domain-containing protein [Leptolyngbya sp. FACHB-16]|uniref:GUN4 domain-containing protein n=1 Tax=unclassified Leptolyngbya TaxID=2650499 RepID=UPI00168787D6|nr:GUN4 domain-containing protein [Leptolyngbya sp. FACHB-16]MBD2156400.1 GUN4 domain-containing protein [Leptolyngbya sp. FACHB-16]